MIANKLLRNGLRPLNDYEDILYFWLDPGHSYLISPISYYYHQKLNGDILQMCSPFQIQNGFDFKGVSGRKIQLSTGEVQSLRNRCCGKTLISQGTRETPW